jgi:hypothetical protein
MHRENQRVPVQSSQLTYGQTFFEYLELCCGTGEATRHNVSVEKNHFRFPQSSEDIEGETILPVTVPLPARKL